MRVYVVELTDVAVTAVQDLWEINAAADSIVCLLRVDIAQRTDVKDAEEEILLVRYARSTGVSGSGGGTQTANAVEAQDSGFGGSVERNNTTQATAQAALKTDGWNIRIPYLYVPTPEERIWIPPSGRLVIALPVAPADSITVTSTITIGEVG